ncbi:MAG TPA: right-handed parallel beta-helix repeat-containing protein [Blastococcus sp.]
MITPAPGLVSGRRLLMATLLIGALLAVPVALASPDPPDPPAPARLPARTPSTAVSDTQVAAERQYSALAHEDERLLALVGSVRPGSGPYVDQVNGQDTLVLTARGPAYGLRDLRAVGAVTSLPDGSVLLTQSVLVAPGARLVIDAPGTTLRLRSDGGGFVSLVAWKADLVLAGKEQAPLRVSSWDPGAEGPDSEVVDGRAYIREVSGDMQVRYADVSHLGFWAGRTSGVAWTGNSSTVATGAIVGSTFQANHYGAFASQGQKLSVVDSAFTSNAVDGLALHRSTQETTIRSSSAQSNGRHGFSADRGSESVTLVGVTAARNRAYGVFFSGESLSAGQSAGGAPLRTYGEVEVEGGELRENGKAGLRVVEGHRVVVRGTRVADNRDGIVLAGTAAPTTVEKTVVTGVHRLGISVTGGSAAVSANRVSGGETGIRIRDAAVAVTGNVVDRSTGHAVSVLGRATGSSVVGNTVSGRGPSGLDTFRLASGVSIDTSRNDVTGWTQDRDNGEYWSAFVPSHPMLVLWVVILGVPLAVGLRARNRRIPLGTAPYADPIRRERPVPLRVDVGGAMTPRGSG